MDKNLVTPVIYRPFIFSDGQTLGWVHFGIHLIHSNITISQWDKETLSSNPIEQFWDALEQMWSQTLFGQQIATKNINSKILLQAFQKVNTETKP